MTRTQIATAWVMGLSLWLGACACGQSPEPGVLLSISTDALPRARQGEPYEATVNVRGGSGGGYAWSVVQGQLPEGLTLEEPARARLRIVGTPQRAGVQEFVLALEGGHGERATRALRLEVGSSLALSGSTRWEATEGLPCPAEARATGGSGAGHRWSVVSGELPPGLSLQPEGDVLRFSGTPAPGRFQFTLGVEDSDGTRVERLAELGVRSSLAIRAAPPVAARMRSYFASLAVVGGIAPYRWTLVGAAAPEGVSLGCETCATTSLMGQPRATGDFPLVLRVEDANGGVVERPLTLRVVEPLELVTTSLPGSPRAAPYSVRLESRGGDGDKRWSVVYGELPPGVTLMGEGDTALLRGAASREGFFSFRVRVEDSAGFAEEGYYFLWILPNPPRIVTAALPEGMLEQPYETVVVGAAPVGGAVRWKLVAGWLPPGVELKNTQTASLTLSGVARVAGTFPVTVELSDDGGVTRATYTLRIGHEARFEVRSSVLPDARVGTAYAARVKTVAAEGPVGGWTVVDGALPSGLALEADGAGGARLAGMPDTAGFYRFALQAADAGGHTSRKDFSLQVSAARRWAVLAHSTSFHGAQGVTVVDLKERTGQTRWQLGVASQASDFTFSPDGAWLSYRGGDPRSTSLYLAGLREPGSSASLVVDTLRGENAGVATFSPDGRWWVYSLGRGAQTPVYSHQVRDLSGSGSTIPLEPSWTAAYRQSWSPDGTRLLLTPSSDTRLRLWSPSGAAQTVQVAPEVGALGGEAVWTPDSRSVVFNAVPAGVPFPSRLYRLELSGSASARPLALTPPDLRLNSNAIQRSPDGTRLAFVGEREGSSAVYVLELGHGPPRAARQVNGGVSGLEGVFWSPDSRHLLMTQPASAQYVSYVADVEAAEGAQPVRLGTPGLGPSRSLVRWAPDGVHVVYASDEGLSLVRAVGAPSVTTVTPPPFSLHDYVALPGAGRRLVYHSSGGLYLADPDAPSGPRAPVRLDTAGHLEVFSLSDLERTGDLLYFNLNSLPRVLWWVDARGPEPTPPLQLLDLGEGIVSVRTY